MVESTNPRQSKYGGLFEALRAAKTDTVRMTFDRVEVLIGDRLPASAYRTKAFWSNRARGGLQAAAWLQAGFEASKVDLDRQVVTFRRRARLKPSALKAERWSGGMVRMLRRELQLSQAELAARLGVRQQTISEWERGCYQPTRSRSMHLALVAEKARKRYHVGREVEDQQRGTEES